MKDLFSGSITSKNEAVTHDILTKAGVSLTIKREDQIHPIISGNKFRKLKYNLLEAKQLGFKKVLTFGGAYSNHILATAEACRYQDLNSIGVIRGEELAKELKATMQINDTLRLANAAGMHLKFVSRTVYRTKNSESYIQKLKDEFGDFYLIPEGGTNTLAIKGCQEVLSQDDKNYDIICCAVGTGGTISGLINSADPMQFILGFPALKGEFLKEEIKKYTSRMNWKLITNYHFGGYAKVTSELISTINDFNSEQGILLDPVYTGKMIFGILDLVKNGYFKKNTRILAIHTGGQQGILGMNKRLEKTNIPCIKL